MAVLLSWDDLEHEQPNARNKKKRRTRHNRWCRMTWRTHAHRGGVRALWSLTLSHVVTRPMSDPERRHGRRSRGRVPAHEAFHAPSPRRRRTPFHKIWAAGIVVVVVVIVVPATIVTVGVRCWRSDWPDQPGEPAQEEDHLVEGVLFPRGWGGLSHTDLGYILSKCPPRGGVNDIQYYSIRLPSDGSAVWCRSDRITRIAVPFHCMHTNWFRASSQT